MEPGTNGGYTTGLASSEVPSPAKATRSRRKHDDEVDHRYTSRKRGRREKDSDGAPPPKYLDEPRDHYRSAVGDKIDPASNGNATAAAAVPVQPGTVLFLTHPGREDISSGKSLLELMRRSSRQKPKRRDDPRTEEAYFAVHDTVMVPQGLVDKIDVRLKDDVVAKIVVDHTNNWIKLSSFGHSREFMQNLTQVVQPRYPCNYPTLLDEVLVSFLFQRPEYAETLLKPLIQRLTHSNEPVTADKHPLTTAMRVHIGLLRRRGLGHGPTALSTRHQIATLAIVKTLFEGNDGNLLLNPWILACLHDCTDELLHVVVAKLTNSITYLALIQPEPHNLEWLRMWQNEHWDVPNADVQVEALLRLERHDKFGGGGVVGAFHAAVVREALMRFGYAPQGDFHLFADAFQTFFQLATPTQSFPLLDDTVHKYPPPYPNDASYKHPVVALLGLFQQTMPRGGRWWFVGHLWPFLLERHVDTATLRLVFQEYVLGLVFGPEEDADRTRPLLLDMHAAVDFLDAFNSVTAATSAHVFDVWTQVWTDPSFDVPVPVVLTMICVAVGLQHGQWHTAAKRAVVNSFSDLAAAVGSQCFASVVAQSATTLGPLSWLLHAVLLGDLASSVAIPTCHQVLLHVADKPCWTRLVQQLLVVALVAVRDEVSCPASTPTFYDSTTSAMVPFPLRASSSNTNTTRSPHPMVYRLQVLTALIQDTRHPPSALFVRRQLVSATCFDSLLDLASSTRQDVALHALRLLGELAPTSSHDIESSSPFGQDTVVHVLVRLVSLRQCQVAAAALALVDRLATVYDGFVSAVLLDQCAALDVPTIVQLTNVTKRRLRRSVEGSCWRDVVQFIDRQFLLGMAGSWQDASAQHVALLMLRHLCHVDLRREWSRLICLGIRTLESSTEPLCLIQLDIVLWIVSHDQRHQFRAEFEHANVHQQVERLLSLPQWHVPSILAMAHQALKGLDCYMAAREN
ncbi:hypothetical protein DYB35_011677 [Aphanomyces astaci]|uniref:Uncharacterized protein n=1 Tax=Aphanomyces astaci TaxID=112090 RepID=A0A418DTN6_APHAT|nr:hypothetical protein DYB35_011677 [Aphanomyces astaci]